MECKDSKLKGNITELQVMTYITNIGYQVSVPFGDRERYDQIWDINGGLYKVQVKTASLGKQENTIKFSCRSSCRKNGKCHNANYKKCEIDFFATFWENKCYVVPIEETSNVKTLRLLKTKNSQVKNINFADDYLAEKTIERLCSN